MKFLIQCENQRQRIYLTYLLESTFSYEVSPVKSFSEIDISGGEYFAVISKDESPSENELELLKVSLGKKPFLYISSNADAIRGFSSAEENKILHDPNDIQLLIKKVSEQLGIRKSYTDIQERFIPVRTDYLFKVDRCQCDIFIKLSDEKYLKIFKDQSDLSIDELVRLHKKNIEYVYVKNNDFEKLLDSMNAFPEDYSALPEKEAMIEMSKDLLFAQDAVHQLALTVGLNKKAMIYVNKSLELLYAFMDRDQNLKSIWGWMGKDKSFVTQHSIMVACLANAILEQTNFRNEANSLKLSLAATLHDMGIRNDSFYEKFHKFELMDESELKERSKREIDSYKSHVIAAGEILERFENAPADVDKILLHHHEKYDGSGFPRGLGWSKIPFLSTVFIVAHEFVVHIFKTECDEKGFSAQLALKKEEYKEGAFKEAIEALERVRR